jgi:alanine dehydrogenase
MIIGVPTEIKTDEYRVAMTPAGVEELRARKHTVLVQAGAGMGSGMTDAEYRRSGAQIVKKSADIFRRAEMIVKVKEPMEAEFDLMREGQVIFTYFHLAASRELTDALIARKIRAVAYETISPANGGLPLLTPMSEVAGRMSIQEGAKYLEKPMEGRGILLGGVPGVPPAEVVIIGGGIVGSNAAKVAAGLGARVTILEKNLDRMRYLDDIMPGNVTTLMSNAQHVREMAVKADLLVGAVLIAGARTPMLVKRDVIRQMKPGAVIVDVSIDQGGCFETSRPTTHKNPIYKVNDVVHYCVTNIPGAVGRTSTLALTHATLPYALEIAEKGLVKAAANNIAIRRGINLFDGKVTYQAVAETFGLAFDEL